jgi:hypothetical protein
MFGIILHGCFFYKSDSGRQNLYEYHQCSAIDTLALIKYTKEIQLSYQKQYPEINWNLPGYYIFTHYDRTLFGDRLYYYNPDDSSKNISVYVSSSPENIQKCFFVKQLDSTVFLFLKEFGIESKPKIEFLRNETSYYGISKIIFGSYIKDNLKQYFLLKDFRPEYYEAKDGSLFTLHNIPNPPQYLTVYEKMFEILNSRIINWDECEEKI